MNQNKNQLTTTTGNGVALRNASKSLKITNKLLAEVDDFEKHWEWWLSLDKNWQNFLRHTATNHYKDVINSDRYLIQKIINIDNKLIAILRL